MTIIHGQNLLPPACLIYGVPQVVAISVSAGGIPKTPQKRAHVSVNGLECDGRNHAKHIRADRAVSLFDLETMIDLRQEGFPLTPGAIGENLTVVGLHVQRCAPGTKLRIGDVVLVLTEPRRPCYVLDAIDPRLKDVIVGRCGYMAKVACEGEIVAGMEIRAHVDHATRSDSGEMRIDMPDAFAEVACPRDWRLMARLDRYLTFGAS